MPWKSSLCSDLYGLWGDKANTDMGVYLFAREEETVIFVSWILHTSSSFHISCFVKCHILCFEYGVEKLYL